MIVVHMNDGAELMAYIIGLEGLSALRSKGWVKVESAMGVSSGCCEVGCWSSYK